MSGLFKLIQGLAILAALIAGGLAVWNRRDKVKDTWESLGGTEGVLKTATKVAESAGPVRDFVNQVSHLK